MVNSSMARSSYPLSAAEIVGIALHVADALIHAHGLGIVHGNITPSNIMVAPGGQVKLLNFGFGREMIDDWMEWPDWPKSIMPWFTRYISPEQCWNQEESRSDFFSLGIVLYEMATRRYPFRDPDYVASPCLDQQPEPVTGLNSGISAEVGHIIHRCLEKDLNRRYQSARDLAEDLRNVS
jgi:serine/threonine-protein kinase